MSSQNKTELPPPLDISGWSCLPTLFMVIGGILSVIGLVISGHKNSFQEFGYSWLLAFLFFYSLALGSLFLVMIHHLSGAGWSVGIRRFCEHLASLLGWPLVVMFLPVAIFAKHIYKWMSFDPATNNLVAAKLPVFTMPGFYITSAIFFAIVWFLSSRLSSLSLQQDKTGAAEFTHKMSFYSGWGIVALGVPADFFRRVMDEGDFLSIFLLHLRRLFLFRLPVDRAGDGLYHRGDFVSPAHLESFVAGKLFLLHRHAVLRLHAVFRLHGIRAILRRLEREHAGRNLLVSHPRTRQLVAVESVLIFGHFFVPFFVLLPLKVKTNFKVMIPVCLWAWLMHALDLGFNIFPALHPDGYHFKWIWLPLGTLMFVGGFLASVFLKKFNANPPYPQRDPRLLEAMGVNA